MKHILFYLILKPISILPLSILYLLSDFLFFILYRIIPYRRKVVLANLKNAFPDRSPEEIRKISKKFYRHFCDLVVESVRLFSISQAEIVKRIKLLNPELIQGYYDRGQSVVMAAGHYNNWEMAAVAFDVQIPHQSIGIYTPLSNSFFNKKILQSREKFGLQMIPKNEVKENFESNKDNLIAMIFATDQSPSRTGRKYWTHFLNQETAVLFGTEKYAKMFNCPVIFAFIRKVNRGYYEVEFRTVTENPAAAESGKITEGHTKLLEEEILEDPAFWLWTHRRWKLNKRQPQK